MSEVQRMFTSSGTRFVEHGEEIEDQEFYSLCDRVNSDAEKPVRSREEIRERLADCQFRLDNSSPGHPGRVTYFAYAEALKWVLNEPEEKA